jgi:hypothetical protein
MDNGESENYPLSTLQAPFDVCFGQHMKDRITRSFKEHSGSFWSFAITLPECEALRGRINSGSIPSGDITQSGEILQKEPW